MRRLVLLFVLLLIAAAPSCASRPRGDTSSHSNQGTVSNNDSGTPLSTAPPACTADAKDATPCVQECDRGIASACSTLALRAEKGAGIPLDVTRAVTLHERACELRDASECVAAARMHANGMGVSPNRAKQMELLVMACNLGDAAACSVPAKAYAGGTGVARDEHKARALWERACAGGVEKACEQISDGGVY